VSKQQEDNNTKYERVTCAGVVRHSEQFNEFTVHDILRHNAPAFPLSTRAISVHRGDGKILLIAIDPLAPAAVDFYCRYQWRCHAKKPSTLELQLQVYACVRCSKFCCFLKSRLCYNVASVCCLWLNG